MDTNEIKVRLENLVGDIPEIELIVIFEISGTQVVSNSLEKKNAEWVIQEGMKSFISMMRSCLPWYC